MKILLAGPGTGKTTRVKSIIAEDYPRAEKIKVISFTNATVKDLLESFNQNPNVSCSTLHSFALKLNHLPELHIIDNKIENKIILSLSKKLEIDFAQGTFDTDNYEYMPYYIIDPLSSPFLEYSIVDNGSKSIMSLKTYDLSGNEITFPDGYLINFGFTEILKNSTFSEFKDSF